MYSVNPGLVDNQNYQRFFPSKSGAGKLRAPDFTKIHSKMVPVETALRAQTTQILRRATKALIDHMFAAQRQCTRVLNVGLLKQHATKRYFLGISAR